MSDTSSPTIATFERIRTEIERKEAEHRNAGLRESLDRAAKLSFDSGIVLLDSRRWAR